MELIIKDNGFRFLKAAKWGWSANPLGMGSALNKFRHNLNENNFIHVYKQ